MRRDDSRHGTYAGWNQHKKEGKRPCRACLNAATEYQKKWRLRNPLGRKRGAKRQAALNRAYRRLGQLYPEKLQELLNEELGR